MAGFYPVINLISIVEVLCNSKLYFLSEIYKFSTALFNFSLTSVAISFNNGF